MCFSSVRWMRSAFSNWDMSERIRKELHGKKEKSLIALAINNLIHRPQVIGKLGSLSSSAGHAE
jgi:hypothetical protein